MLDKFVGTQFGHGVAKSCVEQHLAELPSATTLVVMFGYGTAGNYASECYRLFSSARPGPWRWDERGVSYSDGRITVVHVEHFASQGALIPQWLGQQTHPRSELGRRARAATSRALARP
jgi:hypothetical protein